MSEIKGKPDLVKKGFIIELKTAVEEEQIDQMISYLELAGLDEGKIMDNNGNVCAWIRRLRGSVRK